MDRSASSRLAAGTLLGLALASAAVVVRAAQAPPPAVLDPKAAAFFETRVRPLLAQQCFACHGEKQQKGGLRMDTAPAFFKGGDTGALVVPGHPGKSLLIGTVSYARDLKMPPQGKLKAAQIADLQTWVRMGAPWPGYDVRPPAAATPGAWSPTPEQRRFWSFQPVRESIPPPVRGRAWVANPVDAFVLARLEARGLRPAPTADRRTLLRRVTFDLAGLPPTLEELDGFLADRSPGAWEKVVDRLLASPAYGERWARHWLDVARYADSNGLDENTAFANAWRYRDYVVRAFNDDKPYDRFVQEQLAGDLLPAATEAQRFEQLTATGFLGLGPKVLAEPDKQKMVMDIVDEQIDTVGKAVMGLTLGCARCHDHKFDPLPTRDYYAFAGIFKSTRTMESLRTVAHVFERPLGPQDAMEARRKYDEAVKKLYDRLNKVKQDDEKARLQAEMKELQAQAPPEVPMVVAVEEAPEIGNVRVHLRGSHLTLGEEAPRQFLRVLAGDRQTPIDGSRSGRLELAQWVTRPDHPLTARVMANRVWQHHFGEGIVRSPDNFGLLGDRPTHPELLDYLAARLVRGDGGQARPTSGSAAGSEAARPWSIKALHRLIVTSNSYKMSTRYDARAALADPENRLLWRFNRRRLEVEAIRDSMHFVADTLDRTMGGSLLKTPNFAYVTNDQSANAAQYDSPRRALYLPVIRNAVYDVFQVFDFVEPSFLNGKRSATTVAPQALFLLNGKLVMDQARHLAERLLAAEGDDANRVRRAYRLAYAREAVPAEVFEALDYLRAFESRLGEEPDVAKRRLRAWQSFCQSIFASSEFVYVD